MNDNKYVNICIESKPIVAYYPNSEIMDECIRKTISSEYSDIVPFVDYVGGRLLEYLTVTDKNNSYTNRVREYRADRDSQLDDYTLNKTIFNYNGGDVKASPSKFVLNFTSTPVVTVNELEIPMVHPPTSFEGMKRFDGSVVIIEVVPVSSPESFSNLINESAVYENTITKLGRHSQLPKVRKSMAILTKAKELHEHIKYNSNFNSLDPTIYVGTISILGGAHINTIERGGAVYDSMSDLVFYKGLSTEERPLHPRTLNPSGRSGFGEDDLKIYINDPKNKLPPLYTFLADRVTLIPVRREPTDPTGLFIGTGIGLETYDREGNELELGASGFYPLEEVLGLDFIFTSVSEANLRADGNVLEANRHEEMKRSHELNVLARRRELEEEKHRLEVEKAEWEHKQRIEKAEREAELETLKHELELSRNLLKQQEDRQALHMRDRMDREKWIRDVEKSQTDATLNKLKLYGGAIALCFAGYAAYKKYLK